MLILILDSAINEKVHENLPSMNECLQISVQFKICKIFIFDVLNISILSYGE